MRKTALILTLLLLASISFAAAPLELSWDFDEENALLSVTLESVEEINAKLALINQSNDVIAIQEVQGPSPQYFSIQVPKTYHQLVVNNIPNKTQQRVDVSLSQLPTAFVETESSSTCSESGGSFCVDGLVCATGSFVASDGACCLGSCVPVAEQGNLTSALAGLPLISWVAILLGILALASIYTALTHSKRRRKK